MHILNYGSLNVDLVYRVPHISHPGETMDRLVRRYPLCEVVMTVGPDGRGGRARY